MTLCHWANMTAATVRDGSQRAVLCCSSIRSSLLITMQCVMSFSCIVGYPCCGKPVPCAPGWHGLRYNHLLADTATTCLSFCHSLIFLHDGLLHPQIPTTRPCTQNLGSLCILHSPAAHSRIRDSSEWLGFDKYSILLHAVCEHVARHGPELRQHTAGSMYLLTRFNAISACVTNDT